jgi:DNA helicase HerA-like ATPase
MARAQEEGLARFRAVRRELEASVLALATSLDGSRFTFQASLHGLELRLGGYVVLESAAGTSLGQILALRQGRQEAVELDLAGGDDASASMRAGVTIRHATGEGAVVAGDGAAFHDASLRPATAAEVRTWSAETRRPRGAALAIGDLTLAPGVPASVDARGFDRHTFLCGQSGSGKTYALGVILERLLMETTLPMVVLDPNSDFAHLQTARAGAAPRMVERYRDVARGVVVHSARATAEHPLRLRLAELDPAAQAALLRLDPVADREEHAELDALLSSGVPPTVAALEATGRPEARRLALRARNLRIERFGVWAGEAGGSVLDALVDPAERCVVVDLGSLATREEQAMTATAVLGELWRRREAREPVLIVIDEAHNVCPATSDDPLTALATDQVIRIAAEGRKFGLYLLLSTQRPQKAHENVVSQCDNLVLMRLNSRADAAFAETVFSFVPASLIAQAATFGLGEALVAGKISPDPTLVRFGERVSAEGGADVATTWADTRA